jgi:hypothetical protein
MDSRHLHYLLLTINHQSTFENCLSLPKSSVITLKELVTTTDAWQLESGRQHFSAIRTIQVNND